MNILLLGIQGSGKSTQGKLLSKKLGVPYLSSGHIFRKIAQEKTRWGRYVKVIINAGFLIPDKKVIPIIEEYLSKPEYSHGYILDGFPRTLYQAKNFKGKLNRVFYIGISDKEALWRLAYRNDVLRGDDNLIAMKKRIEIFRKTTEPVLDFYRKKGLLKQINGEQSIKKVHQDILAK